MAWASLSPSKISQSLLGGQAKRTHSKAIGAGSRTPLQTDSAREVEMQGLSGIISERGKQDGAKGEAELRRPSQQVPLPVELCSQGGLRGWLASGKAAWGRASGAAERRRRAFAGGSRLGAAGGLHS